LAVRAVGPPHRDQAASSNFAHSGPAYVEVAGRPAAAAEDAAYFLSWVDRLAAEVRRRDRVPPRLRDHVEGQIAAAKRVYEKLMEAR